MKGMAGVGGGGGGGGSELMLYLQFLCCCVPATPSFWLKLPRDWILSV